MEKNQDKEIKKMLEEHQESFQTPASLEDGIMQDVARVETKRYASVNMRKVFVFSALTALLVLVALAAQFYFPEVAWLVNAKLTLVCILGIFMIYQVVTWLPSLVERFFKKSN